MIIYLQEYIYSNLNVKSINDKVSGIYYQVPANSKFPYIHIGGFNSKDISVKGFKIKEIYFKLSLYLRDKSIKSMLNLSNDIVNKLKSNENILLHFIEERLDIHNDGITQQVTMNFKAIIGEL